MVRQVLQVFISSFWVILSSLYLHKIFKTFSRKVETARYVHIVMFLDDGECIAKNVNILNCQSKDIKNDLIAVTGLVPSVEKSHWEPPQSIVWLGMNWDGFNGCISISDK